jgi:hypothetical protein
MIEGQKFARKCSVTGEGMDDGYVFRDGDMYFSREEDLLEHILSMGYTTLEEAYNKGEYYWTHWTEQETPDDYQYIVKNGELVEID